MAAVPGGREHLPARRESAPWSGVGGRTQADAMTTSTKSVRAGSATAVRPPGTKLRRFGLAAGALVAPWFILACNTGWAMAQADGASDATGADSLAAAAAHPDLLHNVVLFG